MLFGVREQSSANIGFIRELMSDWEESDNRYY